MAERYSLWDRRIFTALLKKTQLYLLPTPLAGFIAGRTYGTRISMPLVGVLLCMMDVILISYLGWRTVNILSKSVFLSVEVVSAFLETLGVWLTMDWIELAIPSFAPDIIRVVVAFTPGILAFTFAKDAILDVGTKTPNHVKRIEIIALYLREKLSRKESITVKPSDLGWSNTGYMKFMFMDYLYTACKLLGFHMESKYNPVVKGKIGFKAFLNRPEGFIVYKKKKRRKRH